MSNRHNVFVSYHHALDEAYKMMFERFRHIFDVLVSGSVEDGDIDSNLPAETIRQKIRDEYLRDTSVTVVLIGAESWQRKHIDWEIGSSIRQTEYNPRSGLFGILLPTYPRNAPTEYNLHTIPPRLYDNIKCEFATIYNWSDNPTTVQGWIHDAYLRKSTKQPDNSRATFRKNRTGAAWTD
ncbi:MAG: TIR domain-containing protein [Candidatus Delongbacteria bacterium]|nr:TIR domain-containing protein [Candidatus Delongbacteria bacterium]